MTQLESLLIKYDFPKRTTGNELAFEEIEHLAGFSIPEDYKFFLNNFVGDICAVGPEYLRLWDANDLLECNIGYQVFEYLTDILAIGSNGASECIGLEYLGQNSYRIVIFQFIGMAEKEYYIEIGSSFTDMLNRLDSGKEWFS